MDSKYGGDVADVKLNSVNGMNKVNDNSNCDNIKYIIEKGILCILHNVNRLDNENYESDVKFDVTNGSEINLLLQKYFLGQYYKNRHRFPVNLKTSRLLHTYIRWIESNQKRTFQIAYLYLFGYSSFIEISDPLILICNCIRYLKNPSSTKFFDFEILQKYHSISDIITSIRKNVSKIERDNPNIHSELKEFVRMMEMFNYLFDKRLRNSIAHSDYLVKKDWKVLVHSKGKIYPYSVSDIKRLYDMAYLYLEGFIQSINDFSGKLLPGVDISFSWGENY